MTVELEGSEVTVLSVLLGMTAWAQFGGGHVPPPTFSTRGDIPYQGSRDV